MNIEACTHPMIGHSPSGLGIPLLSIGYEFATREKYATGLHPAISLASFAAHIRLVFTE